MSELPAAIHASYRDPAGFIFKQGERFYRQVNVPALEQYETLMKSGLYQALTERRQLIRHTEVQIPGQQDSRIKFLLPEQVPFISYAYEWSFSMLQDAALLTLDITRTALGHGMILKDATPYNIQYYQGRMTFIDTLSFEQYEEGNPWIAYRQFCESFLSPLLLMSYSGHTLNKLFYAWPEGIPLAVTRKLLPFSSRFSVLTYLHLHLHAKYAQKEIKSEKKRTLPKTKLLKLIDSLTLLIRSLKNKNERTEWGNYFAEASGRQDYIDQKRRIIESWISPLNDLKTAVDFGANDGYFSSILAERNIQTIAADADPEAVNSCYLKNKHRQAALHPLIVDFTYPSPAIGTGNEERLSFIERLGKRDLALCLAFIHHLCIGKNIPLARVARLLQHSADQLIIEWVPKKDEKAALLISHKKDIYGNYTGENFEQAFSGYFRIERKEAIPGTERILYLMRKK